MPEAIDLTRPVAAGDLVRTVAAGDLVRSVAADHPDQRHAEPATMAPLFLRVEPGALRPIVVETGAGDEIARFKYPGDAAIFVSHTGKTATLPAEIVRQYELQRPGL